MSKIFRTKSKNTVISGGRELVVEDFSFDWPRTSKEVDRLAITLSDILHPVASVTFFCTSEDISYGPYQILRTSRYFREVEFEIDSEDGARTVEPYNIHTHPARSAAGLYYELSGKTLFNRLENINFAYVKLNCSKLFIQKLKIYWLPQ